MIVSLVVTLEYELAISLCLGTLHSFTMNASLKWLKKFFFEVHLHPINILPQYKMI